MLPVALIRPPVDKLPAVTLPAVLKLVPVAAPMLGVVNTAPVLTTILPETIAVVVLSTLAENVVPVSATPLLAE